MSDMKIQKLKAALARLNRLDANTSMIKEEWRQEQKMALKSALRDEMLEKAYRDGQVDEKSYKYLVERQRKIREPEAATRTSEAAGNEAETTGSVSPAASSFAPSSSSYLPPSGPDGGEGGC